MNDRMRRYVDRRMNGNDMAYGRNPYGSRGGYVSSRPDRMYDERYDRRYDGRGGYYEGEFRGNTGYGRDYGRDYDYGYNMDMRYGSDYADGKFLSGEEVREWKKKLESHMDKAEIEMLSEQNILKRAKDMGIRYDGFTEDELVLTTIMLFTDYCKTLGKSNVDMYVKLALDFLRDDDAAIRGSEKLTAYHDFIANVQTV